MNRSAAILLALPLFLAACGGGTEKETAGEGDAAMGDTRILEGTIDDSMIDLAGLDNPMTLEGGAQSNGDSEPREQTGTQAAPSEDAAADEPESDASDDAPADADAE